MLLCWEKDEKQVSFFESTPLRHQADSGRGCLGYGLFGFAVVTAPRTAVIVNPSIAFNPPKTKQNKKLNNICSLNLKYT